MLERGRTDQQPSLISPKKRPINSERFDFSRRHPSSLLLYRFRSPPMSNRSNKTVNLIFNCHSLEQLEKTANFYQLLEFQIISISSDRSSYHLHNFESLTTITLKHSAVSAIEESSSASIRPNNIPNVETVVEDNGSINVPFILSISVKSVEVQSAFDVTATLYFRRH